ncbi:hypothetical protein Trydic_g23708, partial [Trypoxylus dichotomus]
YELIGFDRGRAVCSTLSPLVTRKIVRFFYRNIAFSWKKGIAVRREEIGIARIDESENFAAYKMGNKFCENRLGF